MPRTVKKPARKIIAALKQAVEHAKEPTAYDRIAGRVIAAVTEMNAALEEAHKCAEMRVFLGTRGTGDEKPRQFQYHIYRLTHSAMSFAITVEKPHWQLVKDPAFAPATDGLAGAFAKAT